jgi:hypothetical protein
MKFIKISVVCGLVLLGGCTDPNSARKILDNNGYEDINMTGYRLLMCGEDDFYSTGFQATSVKGVKVSGAVCSGFFKGSTIRFD